MNNCLLTPPHHKILLAASIVSPTAGICSNTSNPEDSNVTTVTLDPGARQAPAHDASVESPTQAVDRNRAAGSR